MLSLRHVNKNLSMYPLLFPDDQVLIRKGKEVAVDDLVVFRSKGKYICHRVIYLNKDEGYLVTKGDANKKSDGKIKLSEVLGTVKKVKRNGRLINLRHVYFSESLLYLSEISLVLDRLQQLGLNYVFLKGLPIYLFFEGHVPQRIYFDVDILIKENDKLKIHKILVALGYRPVKTKLFNKETLDFTQINYHKEIGNFSVVIDVHLQAAVGFTKSAKLNRLLPDLRDYSRHLFSQTTLFVQDNKEFSILNQEECVFYLLLHIFHHNFKGYQRYELLSYIVNHYSVNWGKIKELAITYRFRKIIYISTRFLQKYYHVSVPNGFFPGLDISPIAKLLSNLILNFTRIFDDDDRNVARLKRFFLVFIYSDLAFFRKLGVIFRLLIN
jgi:hypothetical protein